MADQGGLQPRFSSRGEALGATSAMNSDKKILLDDLFYQDLIKRSFDDSEEAAPKDSADKEQIWHATGHQFLDNGE